MPSSLCPRTEKTDNGEHVIGYNPPYAPLELLAVYLMSGTELHLYVLCSVNVGGSYFECQRGRLCVIHAWNNGMGTQDVTKEDLITTAKTMPEDAVGAQGFSPDVLIKWAVKYRSDSLERVQGVHRFQSVGELKQILCLDSRAKFLLVSVVVKKGNYKHMICITKDFVLKDSELNAPCTL